MKIELQSRPRPVSFANNFFSFVWWHLKRQALLGLTFSSEIDRNIVYANCFDLWMRCLLLLPPIFQVIIFDDDYHSFIFAYHLLNGADISSGFCVHEQSIITIRRHAHTCLSVKWTQCIITYCVNKPFYCTQTIPGFYGGKFNFLW